MVLHVLTISNILYRCSDDPYVEQVSEERLICVQLTILFHFNPLGPSIIYIFVLSQIFSSVQKEILCFLHSPVALKALT